MSCLAWMSDVGSVLKHSGETRRTQVKTSFEFIMDYGLCWTCAPGDAIDASGTPAVISRQSTRTRGTSITEPFSSISSDYLPLMPLLTYRAYYHVGKTFGREQPQRSMNIHNDVSRYGEEHGQLSWRQKTLEVGPRCVRGWEDSVRLGRSCRIIR